MRDRENICGDVNNAEYRGNIYNFSKLTKKELLKYLRGLIKYERVLHNNTKTKYIQIKKHKNSRIEVLTFDYLYKLYDRNQIENGISTTLFKIGNRINLSIEVEINNLEKYYNYKKNKGKYRNILKGWKI